MSTNPLTSKIAVPYARGLFEFAREKKIIHEITSDFRNLNDFFEECPQVTEYLNNPTVKPEAKRELLEKRLNPKLMFRHLNF